MKKQLVLILTVFLSLNTFVFCQTLEEKSEATTEETSSKKNFKTFIPPFAQAFLNMNYTFDEGISYCQLTRIEQIENASNYVRENMMLGAYFTAQTVDLSFIDLIATVSVYYPFYQAFNGMEQKPRNLFNFAIDSLFGATITYDRIKYVDLSLSLGMHYMYQLTDEYYMHYLGLGAVLGLEFPIFQRWTIVENNFFSYDNPNLGSNKNIQPFDGAYQFHFSIGVKYSRKVENDFYYFKLPPKQKKIKNPQKESNIIDEQNF